MYVYIYLLYLVYLIHLISLHHVYIIFNISMGESPISVPCITWRQEGQEEAAQQVSKNLGIPKWLVYYGLFHGKSQSKMDDLGVSLF